MFVFFLIRTAAGLFGVAILGAAAWAQRRTGWPILGILLTLAAGSAALLTGFFLWVLWQHLWFPFQLETLELTVLQHAARLAGGEPVYPEPSHEFVALAYNPGLYVLLRPVLWVAAPSLPVLRLPAVLSTLALIGLFGWVAGRAAGSVRWGMVAAALPVLAMRSLDGSLSAGHGDAPMLFAGLLGALLLGSPERSPGRVETTLAAVLFASSFWLKQPAGMLGLGAGLLLLLRDRRNAWLPLTVLAVLGPLAYLGFGAIAFGPDFLPSTLTVPASWASWSWPGPARLGRFLLRWWAVPVLTALAAYGVAWRDRRLLRDPLLFLLPFAGATALMGALDLGSNDNVFATFGVWCLFIFARVASAGVARESTEARRSWAVAGLVFCAAFLVHDVRQWLPSGRAHQARADLEGLLGDLDGPLYAPWMGSPPGSVRTTSRAHWVALEDRIRGTEVPTGRDPWIAGILEPVETAPSPAYLLLPHPLEDDRLMSWLSGAYVLEADLGEERFEPLRGLPHRFDVGPPRYLYRRRGDPG